VDVNDGACLPGRGGSTPLNDFYWSAATERRIHQKIKNDARKFDDIQMQWNWVIS